jgi:hypothetical protein
LKLFSQFLTPGNAQRNPLHDQLINKLTKTHDSRIVAQMKQAKTAGLKKRGAQVAPLFDYIP